MSALSEGHLAAVIFCVLGDPLLFCWEEFFLFFLFFPFYPLFPFFCGFLVYWSGRSQFSGVILYSTWSYIPPASTRLMRANLHLGELPFQGFELAITD